jgi:hypothetical protein
MTKVRSEMQTALKWRDIAVEEIRKKLRKLKVYDTGDLISSIQMFVKQSGLNSYKATLLYNYYGIFPDMGVGRGTSAFDNSVRKLVGGKGRKRKNWTREIAHQSHRFGEVLGKTMLENGSIEIVRILPTTITMVM